jgi:hypothetical protein
MTAPEPSAAEIDNDPPATAAEWLEAGPEDRLPGVCKRYTLLEDRHPYGFEPRIDPASISDRDLLACLGMPDPEPEAEP